MTAPPHNATTVLLLRESDGLEAFLVKRTSKSSFMANAYVYPGGRVDDADADTSLRERVTGRAPAECASTLGIEDPELATSFYLAGIRESFEEAGLLLAHRTDDEQRQLIDLSSPDVAERFAEWRHRVHSRDCTLLELAEQEDLRFPLDRLHAFAHWITPAFERKRFDTWFFLTYAPGNQALAHDKQETVASEWIAPAAALQRHRDGDLHLFPPTFRTLEEMARFDSWERLLSYASEKPKPPVMPEFETLDGVLTAILPGDERYPDPSVPAVLGATRIVLEDNHWRSM